MKLRRRATLVLFVASAALLGTSAPAKVIVTVPPAETLVPAGRMARFRVVLTPEDGRRVPNRFFIVARHAHGNAPPAGAKLILVSEAKPEDAPIEVAVLPRGETPKFMAEPGRRPDPDPARLSEQATVPLPGCERASCTHSFRAYTEPPTDVVLALDHGGRTARQEGMFPFDGPDFDGTREAMAKSMRFYVQPSAPAPRPEASRASEPEAQIATEPENEP